MRYMSGVSPSRLTIPSNSVTEGIAGFMGWPQFGFPRGRDMARKTESPHHTPSNRAATALYLQGINECNRLISPMITGLRGIHHRF